MQVPRTQGCQLGGEGGGGSGAYFPGKCLNMRSSNCWKCIEILNPAITVLLLKKRFLYMKKTSAGSSAPSILAPESTRCIMPPIYVHPGGYICISGIFA